VGVLVGVVAIAFIVTASPVAAMSARGAGRSMDNQVVLTGTLVVPVGERVDNAITLNGDVQIDGTVDGRVVALNGDIVVAGVVDEDAIAPNGRVTVTNTGHVGGDAVSRHHPRVAPGGVVEGHTRDLGKGWGGWAAVPIGAFAIWLAVSVSSLVLGLVLLVLLPRADLAVADVWRNAVGRSIGWGILVAVLLPIIGVVLAATVVALPLGVAILFALGLVYATGYVVAAHGLGRRILSANHGRFVAFLTGWAILRALALVPGLGLLVTIAAVVYGLGICVVAGARVRRGPEPTKPEEPGVAATS
jgi:cytoskeletal protein CcmA (bactofilin family)